EGICINQSVATIRLKKESIDVKFLFYLLASPKIQQRILLDAGGSTIKHIYITKLGKMMIAVPISMDEQKKIVEILVSWDSKIENEHKRLIHQKNIKKGLMQNLLTGKIRVNFSKSEVVSS